ncbi:MAG: PIN domain-containing protein [Povalibacter sp.]
MKSCKAILFVDYENTGTLDLGEIPEDVFVPFFFGASQKTVRTDFLKAALKLGDRFLPIDIEGQGRNALDFHIAFYLGEYLAANPKANCVILSKDTGFDPLAKHLRGREFSVRRAETIAEAFGGAPRQKPTKVKAVVATPKPKTQEPAPLASVSVLAWLEEMSPRTRPRKRKGLIAHLHNHFGKKISEAQLHQIVDQLIAQKKISETEGALGYQL